MFEIFRYGIRWGKHSVRGFRHLIVFHILDTREDEYYHRRYGLLIEQELGFNINLYLWYYKIGVWIK